jgi:hypothetical protein
MSKGTPPIGELFSRLYIERGAPSRDSVPFRRRLEAFLLANYSEEYPKLVSYLKQEAGIEVPTTWLEKYHNLFYNFPKFFSEAPIDEILSAITLIHRFLEKTYPAFFNRAGTLVTNSKVTGWIQFVGRALREENVGYTLDEKCGVHYLVDEEFERNRVSALRAADAARYAAVRAAFENAHHALDSTPPNTKQAVRSMFEALEILAKLMIPGATRLTADLVKKSLTGIVQGTTVEPTERLVLEKMMQGFADYVDGLHFYRHGQATNEPIEPSVPLAVHVLAMGASILRLLLQADAVTQSAP